MDKTFVVPECEKCRFKGGLKLVNKTVKLSFRNPRTLNTMAEHFECPRCNEIFFTEEQMNKFSEEVDKQLKQAE